MSGWRAGSRVWFVTHPDFREVEGGRIQGVAGSAPLQNPPIRGGRSDAQRGGGADPGCGGGDPLQNPQIEGRSQ